MENAVYLLMSQLKPQDIIVLLKALIMGRQQWKFERLQEQLALSTSAIYRALERCVHARFISPKPFSKVFALNLSEFLEHGIAYAFATEPGKLVRGIPTAHSAPPLNKEIISGEQYVWPSIKGTVRGQAIEPLDKRITSFITDDPELYELLALIDAIRVGKTREKNMAAQLLKERLQDYADKY